MSHGHSRERTDDAWSARHHALSRRPSRRRGARRSGPCATLVLLPVPDKRLKDEVDDAVDRYAVLRQDWLALIEVDTHWRGSFGHLTALVAEDSEQLAIPLCRIEYLGDDNAWGFAIC